MIRRALGHSLAFLALVAPAAALPAAARAQAPGVESFARPPQTPAETWERIDYLVRVGQPAQAVPFLKQFTAANPDDTTMIALRDEYGQASFFRLLDAPETRPFAAPLLGRLSEAGRRFATRPDRLASAIASLSKTREERSYGVERLREAGAYAVPSLIQALGQPALAPDDRVALIDGLGALDTAAVPPLVAALDAPDGATASAAAQGALGASATPEAVAPLTLRRRQSKCSGPRLRAAGHRADHRHPVRRPARVARACPDRRGPPRLPGRPEGARRPRDGLGLGRCREGPRPPGDDPGRGPERRGAEARPPGPGDRAGRPPGAGRPARDRPGARPGRRDARGARRRAGRPRRGRPPGSRRRAGRPGRLGRHGAGAGHRPQRPGRRDPPRRPGRGARRARPPRPVRRGPGPGRARAEATVPGVEPGRADARPVRRRRAGRPRRRDRRQPRPRGLAHRLPQGARLRRPARRHGRAGVPDGRRFGRRRADRDRPPLRPGPLAAPRHPRQPPRRPADGRHPDVHLRPAGAPRPADPDARELPRGPAPDHADADGPVPGRGRPRLAWGSERGRSRPRRARLCRRAAARARGSRPARGARARGSWCWPRRR